MNLVLLGLSLLPPLEGQSAALHACFYLRSFDAVGGLLFPVVVEASIVFTIASQVEKLSF